MTDKYSFALAGAEDEAAMADIFIGHIDAHREYISHGEMQMGVATGQAVGGDIVCRPADDARERWLTYIHDHITSNEAVVYKVVDNSTGEIVAFCVAEIEEDEGCRYGMVCDVLVRETCRGGGVGGRLLQMAIDWLHSHNINEIYLESGKNNAAAHAFFEKRGFIHVSEIFKLS